MEAKKSSNLKKFFATVVSAFISRWKPLGLNVAIRILQKCSTTSHLLNVKFLVGMTNKQTLANVYFEIETAYSFFNFFFIAPEMCKPSKMDYTIFLMEFPPPFFFSLFLMNWGCTVGLKNQGKDRPEGRGKQMGGKFWLMRTWWFFPKWYFHLDSLMCLRIRECPLSIFFSLRVCLFFEGITEKLEYLNKEMIRYWWRQPVSAKN